MYIITFQWLSLDSDEIRGKFALTYIFQPNNFFSHGIICDSDFYGSCLFVFFSTNFSTQDFFCSKLSRFESSFVVSEILLFLASNVVEPPVHSLLEFSTNLPT